MSFWPAEIGVPVAEVDASLAPSMRFEIDGNAEGRADFVHAAVTAADGGGVGVGDFEQAAGASCKCLWAMATNSGLFLSSGKMPALIGAMRGVKRSTMRISSLPLSSSLIVSSS